MIANLTIGKIAAAAGVGVETVRFYEREGIIEQPSRPDRRTVRRYPMELVTRIRFIREAQQLGFSLREVRELLALQANPAGDCADVRARAVAKRDAIGEKIANLQRISAALDMIIAACPAEGGLDRCTILGVLSSPASVSCDGRCQAEGEGANQS